MKNQLTILTLLSIFLFSCSKEQSYEAKSPFPTSIQMGSDATYFRADSVCLCGYSAYLNTCGTAPQFESQSMGSEVYQIAGNTTARITWKNVNGVNKPQAANLSTGIYKFVGHAWVIGYRSCDGLTMNDNVYDTIQITISKNKRSK